MSKVNGFNKANNSSNGKRRANRWTERCRTQCLNFLIVWIVNAWWWKRWGGKMDSGKIVFSFDFNHNLRAFIWGFSFRTSSWCGMQHPEENLFTITHTHKHTRFRFCLAKGINEIYCRTKYIRKEIVCILCIHMKCTFWILWSGLLFYLEYSIVVHSFECSFTIHFCVFCRSQFGSFNKSHHPPPPSNSIRDRLIICCIFLSISSSYPLSHSHFSFIRKYVINVYLFRSHF